MGYQGSRNAKGVGMKGYHLAVGGSLVAQVGMGVFGECGWSLFRRHWRGASFSLAVKFSGGCCVVVYQGG